VIFITNLVLKFLRFCRFHGRIALSIRR